MSFFSELFDTGLRADPSDLAAAKALFMLRALGKQPCDLSSSHAFGCPLIFDDFAKDVNFRLLVSAGRIRFRKRPDGTTGPRQALIAGLKDENYRLDCWPEIWPKPETQSWDAARYIRKQAVAFLENPSKVKNPDVDDIIKERLTNLDSLFQADEECKHRVSEIPRGTRLRDEIRKVYQRIPPDQYSEVRSLMKDIGRKGFLDRSAIYTAIESDERTTVEIEQQAKDIVNSVFNAVTAECLEQDLLSIDRLVPLRPRDGGHGPPRRHGITVTEPLNDSELRALSREAISWEDIYQVHRAWTDPVLSKDKAEESLDRLVKVLAEKRIAISLPYVSPLISKVVTTYGPPIATTGALLVPYFSGALEHFSKQTIVATLATSVFATLATERVKEVLKERTKHKIKRKLTGWLERCGEWTL